MSDFKPTHEFHLPNGTVVPVAAELRGDWVAYEEDGKSWYTVCGDTAPHWYCRERKAGVVRVVKYGHRFRIATNGKSHRFVCECGDGGNWVRSNDRAIDGGKLHHRDAVHIEWNGMCPTGKHGLDFEGQDCDVCRREQGGPCSAICRRCLADRRRRLYL